MASHRRGGLKKNTKLPSLEPDSQDKFEDLLVFGYACKLFRDDDRALQIEQGKLLIPWMGDDGIKIDRYDARGTLSDLKPHEAPPGGYDRYEGLTPEERKMEKLIDEERYFALYKNEEEEATIKEEEVKRLQQDLQQVTSQETTYNQVPFNYSDTSTDQSQPTSGGSAAEKSIQGELGDATYVPPPELEVPDGTVVPPTQKLARIIIKTAAFISTQGAQMEIIVKAKQANNPMFQFLHFDCVLHPFYRHVLGAIRTGAYVPVDEEDTSNAASTSNPPSGSAQTENAASDEDTDNESYLHPSLQSKTVEPPADPGKDERPIIDKTASYVARKGRDLEPLILSKGDVRFGFLKADHVHHAYYTRKLALYVEMWASLKTEPPKCELGASGAQVAATGVDLNGQESQDLKHERRKKAALFLNKLRQNKTQGGAQETKTDEDSAKESECSSGLGSAPSRSPEMTKASKCPSSDEVEIIGSIPRDSISPSRSVSPSPGRHRKRRSRSPRRGRSRTPSPRRTRSRSASRSPSSRRRSRSRESDRRRRHHKKRRDRSSDRDRRHHRREKKRRRDPSRERSSRKKKSNRRKRSTTRSPSRSRSRSLSSASVSPSPSPVKKRPAGSETNRTRRTSPLTLGTVSRKLTGVTPLTSSSETSSPLPPQLQPLQPALAKITEGLRAKVIAMIDGDLNKK